VAEGSYAVRLHRPGDPGSLELSGRPRRAPGPGEVEIEVAAASLNFADVLVVLGKYQDIGEGAGYELGLDGAGTVTRTGAGVDGVRRGDRVVFFAEGALASHVVVAAELVVAAPGALSAVEAATLPLAYLTAWYALVRLARLRPGETALIHSAAGGVGLAAVNVAALCGARVLATCGTGKKRKYLEERGLDHVLPSRSLEFAGQVRALAPDGVDVVLNSLTGDAQQAGLGLLRLHGRFVELGKRDIHGGGSIALAPFRNNISMHSVDLLLLSRADRPLVGELLRELAPRWADGSLEPLPHATHDVADAASAIRAMTTGRHIGKLVLTFPPPAGHR
jgi:NADPH:quinone reductase-like Zn-dependent oxidoreductase